MSEERSQYMVFEVRGVVWRVAFVEAETVIEAIYRARHKYKMESPYVRKV